MKAVNNKPLDIRQLEKLIDVDKEVRFGEPLHDGSRHHQLIFCGGKEVGASVEIERGWLQPIETYYTACVEDTPYNRIHLPDWCPAEDKGFIIGWFNTLEQLLWSVAVPELQTI
jgi:hypothetical protein